MKWKETGMSPEQMSEKYGDYIKISGCADENYVKPNFGSPTAIDWSNMAIKINAILDKIKEETGLVLEIHEPFYTTPSHQLLLDGRQICGWDTELLGEQLNNVIADLFDSDTNVWGYKMYEAILEDIESLLSNGFFHDIAESMKD